MVGNRNNLFLFFLNKNKREEKKIMNKKRKWEKVLKSKKLVIRYHICTVFGL